MKSIPENILILCDIRSAQNVGSLFRTADAVGIDLIYLVGITPTPIDKYGRPLGSLSKTALGAERSIAWKYEAALVPLLEDLHADGYNSIAIEQSESAVNYRTVSLSGKTVFILGNEVDGLLKDVLDRVGVIAEIPMHGEKESLNVAVAGGIALFHLLGR